MSKFELSLFESKTSIFFFLLKAKGRQSKVAPRGKVAAIGVAKRSLYPSADG